MYNLTMSVFFQNGHGVVSGDVSWRADGQGAPKVTRTSHDHHGASDQVHGPGEEARA